MAIVELASVAAFAAGTLAEAAGVESVVHFDMRVVFGPEREAVVAVAEGIVGVVDAGIVAEVVERIAAEVSDDIPPDSALVAAEAGLRELLVVIDRRSRSSLLDLPAVR